jgi:pyrroline-5-carboxylate reductase
MASPVIAFIGAGNMGSSLIGGLIRNGHSPQSIIATDANKEKLDELVSKFGIRTTTDNVEAASAADAIIFAIKPQIFKEVATPLAQAVTTKKPLIISIAAGIRIEHMQKWLGDNAAVVRCMPNTPALIGIGATALYANKHVSKDQHKLADDIMRAVGIAVWVQEESLLDTVTALSGSGPAYFFLVMEAMQEGAESLGLDKETARLLIQQTALGAASMAIENDISLAQLRKNVTSPGGTTEKGVSVLEKNKLKDIFKQTLIAAKQRSEELAGEIK